MRNCGTKPFCLRFLCVFMFRPSNYETNPFWKSGGLKARNPMSERRQSPETPWVQRFTRILPNEAKVLAFPRPGRRRRSSRRFLRNEPIRAHPSRSRTKLPNEAILQNEPHNNHKGTKDTKIH